MPLAPDNPDQPELGPNGYAVKLDGMLSLRTASTRPEGAMINALVLIFGMDAYRSGHLSDQDIHTLWEKNVSRVCAHHDLKIVPVLCLEVTDAASN